MKLSHSLKIISTVVLAILASIIIVWVIFLYTPLVTVKEGIRYNVPEGTSLKAVVDDLSSQHVIKHPAFFKLLIRLKGVAYDLKAGQYLFKKGTTPGRMLEQLVTGTGLAYQSFTIVPGKNFKELRLVFARESSLKHTIDTLSDQEIMKELQHPELTPEGQFYPDTYLFAENTQDIVILKKAFQAMQDKLNKAWQTRANNLPFKTPYEALTAASIIEKEAYFEEELPIMAGVMVNRLRKNMLLQFDPTVIYGAGDNYDGTIHRSDLKANNPYNTYVHKGLPPTPICMPSLSAIQAVLHPAQHDYYYFVSKTDGTSHFTQFLNEHQQAVKEARQLKGFFNTALTRYYLLKVYSAKL